MTLSLSALLSRSIVQARDVFDLYLLSSQMSSKISPSLLSSKADILKVKNNILDVEFAKELGLSRIAIFKRVKKGKIRAIRIGRNWAIPADELVSLLAIKNLTVENTMKAQNVILEGEGEPSIEIDAMDDLGWDLEKIS